MGLNSIKTFKIIRAILTVKSFSQRALLKYVNASIGQINHVVNWCIKKRHVTKRSKDMSIPGLFDEPENGWQKYFLVNPLGLLRDISVFRDIGSLSAIELKVRLNKEEVIQRLKDLEMVVCLDSALEHYDSFYRSDRLCVYSGPKGIPEVKKRLSKEPGLLKILVLKADPRIDRDDPLAVTEMDGIKFTSRVQTVIDLFCDEKGYYAKNILKELWGVEV